MTHSLYLFINQIFLKTQNSVLLTKINLTFLWKDLFDLAYCSNAFVIKKHKVLLMIAKIFNWIQANRTRQN